MRLQRTHLHRFWAAAAFALAAASPWGANPAMADAFKAVVGYEAGKIAVRDGRNGAPIVMQRTMPFWDDLTGGQSIAPTVEFVPQETGYDVVYTFTNNTPSPRKQGQMRVGIFTLGPRIKVIDGGPQNCIERIDERSTHVAYARHYPRNMYAPVWVMRDENYAVGVSIQYPILEYQHDVRFIMRLPNGTASSGEGGQGWYLAIALANAPTDGPNALSVYEAVIPPGETRRYVVSVRVNDNPDDWMRTLLPYRDFFRSTYGGVRYDRKTLPINATNLAGADLTSNDNPYGWSREKYFSPDKHGWEPWVNDLSARTGWGGYMLWSASGMYKNNRQNNLPFQFTSRWLDNDKMRTALDSRVGFPALIRRTKAELGFWWGRSCQVMTEWDTDVYENLDPDNPAHFEACYKELSLAAQAGATMIGLDTFNHTRTPTWKLYAWLQRMQFMFPQMRFVIEPEACDILHTLAPMFLRGFNDDTPQATLEDVYSIKNSHYLADFLLPGHEMWAGFRYKAHKTYFDIEVTPERVYNDAQRYASLGFVPVMFTSLPLTKKVDITESWLTTVPADLQIPRKEWKYKPPPSIVINKVGPAGLVDEATRDHDLSNQLPVSGMGETPRSRLPTGPELPGGSMLMLMSGNGGRGQVPSQEDIANSLRAAAATRTGIADPTPTTLRARVVTSNDAPLSTSKLPIIFTGRPTKKANTVIVTSVPADKE